LQRAGESPDDHRLKGEIYRAARAAVRERDARAALVIIPLLDIPPLSIG